MGKQDEHETKKNLPWGVKCLTTQNQDNAIATAPNAKLNVRGNICPEK
jgi:hypothetical protein